MEAIEFTGEIVEIEFDGEKIKVDKAIVMAEKMLKEGKIKGYRIDYANKKVILIVE